MTRVLLIEDDAWQRQHYVDMLIRDGFEVSSAPHALEAIENIDDFEPDVIVLDMMLPSVNGMALMHELRSHSDLAQIPIIVMSTRSDITIEQLKPYGVVGLIDKSTMSIDAIAVAVRKATT